MTRPEQLPPVTLYLRTDGSLLLVKDDRTIEMALTPTQLLTLGMDALSVAVRLDGSLLPAAAEVLETTGTMQVEESASCQPH